MSNDGKNNNFGLMVVMMVLFLSIGAMCFELWGAFLRQMAQARRVGLFGQLKAGLRIFIAGGYLPTWCGSIHWPGWGGVEKARQMGIWDENLNEWHALMLSYEQTYVQHHKQHGKNLSWQRFKFSLPFRLLKACFSSIVVGIGFGSGLPSLAAVEKGSPARDLAQIVGMGMAIPTFLITFIEGPMPVHYWPYTYERYLGDLRRKALNTRDLGACAPVRPGWDRLIDPDLAPLTGTEITYGTQLLTQEMMTEHWKKGTDLEILAAREMKRIYDEYVKINVRRHEEQRLAHIKYIKKSEKDREELEAWIRAHTEFERGMTLNALDIAKDCTMQMLRLRADNSDVTMPTVETAAKVEIAYWNELGADDGKPM